MKASFSFNARPIYRRTPLHAVYITALRQFLYAHVYIYIYIYIRLCGGVIREGDVLLPSFFIDISKEFSYMSIRFLFDSNVLSSFRNKFLLIFIILFFMIERKKYWLFFILPILYDRCLYPCLNEYIALIWFGLVLWHINYCGLFNVKSHWLIYIRYMISEHILQIIFLNEPELIFFFSYS